MASIVFVPLALGTQPSSTAALVIAFPTSDADMLTETSDVKGLIGTERPPAKSTAEAEIMNMANIFFMVSSLNEKNRSGTYQQF
jgi:hypothetical protein